MTMITPELQMVRDIALGAEVFPFKRDIAIVLGLGTSLDRFWAQAKEIYERDAMVFACNAIWKVDRAIPVHYYVAADKHTWKEQPRKIHELFALRYFCPKRYEEFAQVSRLHSFDFASKGQHRGAFEFAENWGDPMGHGFTSVCLAMQLAYMAGAREVHLFGVDCKNDPTTGKTHVYGYTNRNVRVWKRARQGIVIAKESIEKLGVECTIHSDLFGT